MTQNELLRNSVGSLEFLKKNYPNSYNQEKEYFRAVIDCIMSLERTKLDLMKIAAPIQVHEK